MQGSHQKLQQQVEGQVEWWRGQVDELKVQLRGEATRVLDLQKKAYNARMAQEAATQALLHLLSFLLANSLLLLLSLRKRRQSDFIVAQEDWLLAFCRAGSQNRSAVFRDAKGLLGAKCCTNLSLQLSSLMC